MKVFFSFPIGAVNKSILDYDEPELEICIITKSGQEFLITTEEYEISFDKEDGTINGRWKGVYIFEDQEADLLDFGFSEENISKMENGDGYYLDGLTDILKEASAIKFTLINALVNQEKQDDFSCKFSCGNKYEFDIADYPEVEITIHDDSENMQDSIEDYISLEEYFEELGETEKDDV